MDVNLVLLVERLVDRMITRHAHDEQQAKVRANVSSRLALRILGARMGATTEPDEAAALDTLRRDVASSSPDPAAPLRLLELHARLATRMTNPHTRWTLLSSLLLIARDKRKARGNAPNPYAAILPPGPGGGLGLASLGGGGGGGMGRGGGMGIPLDPLRSSSSSLRSSGAFSTLGHGHEEDLPSLSASLRSGVSLPGHDPLALALAPPPAPPATPPRPWARAALERSALESISEPLLVYDVIHACLGIDGQYVRYDAKHDVYLLAVEEAVPETIRALVQQLTTLGCLYRRVRGHVANMLTSLHAEGSAEDVAGRGPREGAAVPPTSLGSPAKSSSSSYYIPKIGAVQQSLTNVLHRELAEYQRFIAILEQQATNPIPSPGGGDGGDAPTMATGGAGAFPSSSPSSSKPYLTLRRLAAWLDEPTARMKTLAVIAAVAAGGGSFSRPLPPSSSSSAVASLPLLRGGALVRAVDAVGRDGDPAVQSLVARIVQSMSEPLLTMTREWLTKGELMDPYHEFYIARGSEVGLGGASGTEARETLGQSMATSAPLITSTRTASIDPLAAASQSAAALWHQGYTIREEMLPPFLTMELAREILRCGRTIHFLKTYCTDDGREEGRSGARGGEGGGGGGDDPAALEEERALARLQQQFTLAASSGGGGAGWEAHAARQQALYASLERVVRSMAMRLDTRLSTTLKSRHALMEHLGGMKRYVLLSQGDFVRTLIEAAREDLSSPARDLTEFRLNGALASAIRLSNAQFDLPPVLSSLRIRLLPAAGAETGWDVLQLTYDPSPALAPLLTPHTMLRYGRLFHLLWRIKRIEYVLSAGWADFKPNGRPLRLRKGDDVDALGDVVRRQLLTTLRRYHVARGEMNHFLTGLESYLSIDVIDTAWGGMMEQLASATNLDEMTLLHDRALDGMLRRALLHDKYASLLSKLTATLDTVLEFAGSASRLHEYIAEILLTLGNRREASAASEAQGTWNRQHEMATREAERMVEELVRQQGRLGEMQERYRVNLDVFCETLATRYDVSAWGLLGRLQRS